MNEWHEYVVEQRDHDLNAIITEEKLKPEDTRKFMENGFRWARLFMTSLTPSRAAAAVTPAMTMRGRAGTSPSWSS